MYFSWNHLQMNEIIKKQLVEITPSEYGVYEYSCEPSRQEIDQAIKSGWLETRSFQTDIDELNHEWNRKAKSKSEYAMLQKEYHSKRIAFFVVNGWADPIVIDKDGKTIKDGLHRYKAAQYLGHEIIDVKLDMHM